MDILVTTPKSAHELAKEEGRRVEKDPDAYWFRTFRNRPNVKEGDRIYFVDQGKIVGYGVIFRIVEGMLKCHVTGKMYSGHHLLYREWHWLILPVSFRGFQGFRYVDRIEGLREKLDKQGVRMLNAREFEQAKKNIEYMKIKMGESDRVCSKCRDVGSGYYCDKTELGDDRAKICNRFVLFKPVVFKPKPISVDDYR